LLPAMSCILLHYSLGTGDNALPASHQTTRATAKGKDGVAHKALCGGGRLKSCPVPLTFIHVTASEMDND